MKKLVYIAVGLMAMGWMAAGCSGTSGNSAKEQEDSIRRADSIAKVEAAIQDSIAKAEEAARLEALRQDSIAQSENFSKAVMALRKIDFSEVSGDNKLKSMGFTGSSRVLQGGDVKKLNYTLTMGEKNCIVDYTLDKSGGYCETKKVTIEGDDALLNKYYQDAKKISGNDYESYCEVTKKGKTVIVEWCGA